MTAYDKDPGQPAFDLVGEVGQVAQAPRIERDPVVGSHLHAAIELLGTNEHTARVGQARGCQVESPVLLQMVSKLHFQLLRCRFFRL